MPTDGAALLDLVTGRRGHFQLESGLHGALWLELESLLADVRRVEPFVATLASSIRAHDVAVVCGPLLGGAFLAQLIAERLEVEFAYAERVSSADDGLFRAEYRVPRPLGMRLRGRRVAMVDDVMSAGSSLRATHAEVERWGAVPAVVGALLVLGGTGLAFFAQRGVPVEMVGRADYESWTAAECPLCREGVALERVNGNDRR
jgi:orotate phosphoribosyltransferase